MRDIPPALQAKLDAGATTLCVCWRIEPTLGDPLGFTDHDEDVAFEGMSFEAQSGFTGSGIERGLGLSIDNTSAKGAICSKQIEEIDIRRGRFDGAIVTKWLVDWTDVDLRLLTFKGEIGEVRRGEVAFEAELRGVSEKLNRPVGRSFLHVCDAALGDARCKVNAMDPTFRGEGAIAEAIDARTLLATGLDGYQSEWFSFGVLTWIDGPASGLSVDVRTHLKSGEDVTVELGRDFVEAPEIGSRFAIIAGCDKRLSTCRGKFANVRNFRGFPYIPGETWMAAYPVEGGVYDGGSRAGS